MIIKKHNEDENAIGIGILGGYSAILVSNFFGFSVVPINLLFFSLPLLFFEIVAPVTLKKVFRLGKGTENTEGIGMGSMATIVVLAFFALFLEFRLLNFWSADKQYALGNNLNKAGQPTQAYTPLTTAVTMLPSEDLYKDELAINMATIAILFNENKDATQAAAFGKQAKMLSDGVVAAHPNNIVYRKTNIRVNYALAQIDPKYIDDAIAQVQEARKLAPTDAKLLYNLGLFYNQKGETENMIKAMNEAIELKPNYVDPYYALALQYTQLAKAAPEKAAEYNAEATSKLNFILKNLDPNNGPAKELLKSL
jgi:tetratricopeptide (TPR) repeat protein